MTMRRYEVVYVLAPTLTEEEVDQYAETFSQAARELGAEIISVEKWEKRKLAFRVKKFWDGYYTILTIEEAAADAVTELERRFKVNDTVIRFLTVRIDEELKRAAKFQDEEAEIEPEVLEEKVAEPKKAEPKEAEPKEAEPEKAEPKKAEVKEAEPKKAAPKKAEVKEAEPKEAEKDKAEPKKVAKKPAKKVKAPEEKPEPAEAESKDAAEEVPVEKPEKE